MRRVGSTSLAFAVLAHGDVSPAQNFDSESTAPDEIWQRKMSRRLMTHLVCATSVLPPKYDIPDLDLQLIAVEDGKPVPSGSFAFVRRGLYTGRRHGQDVMAQVAIKELKSGDERKVNKNVRPTRKSWSFLPQT